MTKDQVTETRRVLKEGINRADRAIDAVRGTPKTLKK
jgi:hypothetical protein